MLSDSEDEGAEGLPTVPEEREEGEGAEGDAQQVLPDMSGDENDDEVRNDTGYVFHTKSDWAGLDTKGEPTAPGQ